MTDQQDVRRAITGLLRAETGLDDVFATAPTWIDEVISGIALAVGDEPIIYLGAAIDREADATFRVGVFTARLLVTAQARVAGGRAAVTTQVQSRRDLLKLELTGTTTGSDSQEDWPGRYRIRAMYRSGLEVTIPSSVVDTPIKRASVEAILDGLRDDLQA